jgi:hypothetical protein
MADCGTISPDLLFLRHFGSSNKLLLFPKRHDCELRSGNFEGKPRPGVTFRSSWTISMRIAAYNVNGVNGRLANLLVWLEEAAPDIVCLQELKAPDDKFPVPVLRSAGYGAVWHGQKSWNGVAILARGAEPVETRRGLPGDPDDPHSAISRRQSAG